MRQRLAIGQTIIHKPKILFLDEPASGLDPEARISLANLFLTLKSEGISLIVSSHILAELDEYEEFLLSEPINMPTVIMLIMYDATRNPMGFNQT